MARKSKSVYERIEEKKQEIIQAEETLKSLNSELQELFQEKDELEMRQLLEQMKANNLDISTALNLLSEPKEETKETKKNINKEPKKEKTEVQE